MDETQFIPMTPLDLMVSDDTHQMLKAMLPYLPPNQAQLFAVLTKLFELKNAIQLQQRNTAAFRAMSTTLPKPETGILQDLKTYGGETGKQMAESVQQLFDMLQLVSLMQNTASSEKEDNT